MFLTNCEGKVSSTKIYHPPATFVAGFLKELTAACDGEVSVAQIAETLKHKDDTPSPAAHRKWVTDALSGKSVDGQPVPVDEQAGPAKAKKAAGSAKKRKRAADAEPEKEKEEEEEEDGGEAVD